MKWQLLHNACWAGDPGEVQTLLAAGADPNQVALTNWRQTPLGRTLEFRVSCPKHEGHVEVVRTLLNFGANPALRSTNLDLAPFEQASFCGLAGAAELLRGFPTSAHTGGMSALWIAAASRLPQPAVIEVSGDCNAIWRNATPLMMAVGHAAHFQVADQLLEQGADPNVGTSLLHASCDWHFEHLIPALIYLAQHGWNVNSFDAERQTALHRAAFLGYSSAVRTLLALGADPHLRDASGAAPLDLAREGKKLAAIRAFLPARTSAR